MLRADHVKLKADAKGYVLSLLLKESTELASQIWVGSRLEENLAKRKHMRRN